MTTVDLRCAVCDKIFAVTWDGQSGHEETCPHCGQHGVHFTAVEYHMTCSSCGHRYSSPYADASCPECVTPDLVHPIIRRSRFT